MVPGEAHLVVAAASALDGHVELVAYSQVLFLEENLQGPTETAGQGTFRLIILFTNITRLPPEMRKVQILHPFTAPLFEKIVS